jgi:hypothetical protein
MSLGYLVGEAEVNQTLEQFKEIYPTRQLIVVYASNREGDRIMVMFPSEEKLGISELENYYKNFIEFSVPKGILVIKNDLTSFARKVTLIQLGSRKPRGILD